MRFQILQMKPFLTTPFSGATTQTPLSFISTPGFTNTTRNDESICKVLNSNGCFSVADSKSLATQVPIQ
jgi:hypothetical protein